MIGMVNKIDLLLLTRSVVDSFGGELPDDILKLCFNFVFFRQMTGSTTWRTRAPQPLDEFNSGGRRLRQAQHSDTHLFRVQNHRAPIKKATFYRLK